MKIKLANIPWSTANLAAAAVLALLFAANTSLRANPLPGAIYTTDVGCNGVDLNIYGSKADHQPERIPPARHQHRVRK